MTAEQEKPLTKKETERRRDEALKRALNTPPKPRTKKKPAKKTGSKAKESSS